ncbi:alpha/beta hydrolase [Nocardia sp. NBC_00508]|uniref:RBBP9/YdeN family alpha/beta hydrolase n=1 Tax=Nocardia sp. NBC_00508 TaxID=2975992 RepID=UPI002E805604|nr:alpha/beta hydrolase [Nocardia sp. NBC_00508]WUD65676.1 alpha/beta hydrolase [Nocardia sp. NBC_00508]
MNHATAPVIVIVAGLGEHTDDHWHTQLAATQPNARTVPPPPGSARMDRHAWVAALDTTLSEITDEVVLVAHSAGVLTVVHWAQHPTRDIRAALLVTPPDFETPLADGYPTTSQLTDHGWNPIPRRRLPFPTILAASTNDPFATRRRVAGMAEAWGSRLLDLGPVGHLDPAAGYGPWPRAGQLIDDLTSTTVHPTTGLHRSHR